MNEVYNQFLYALYQWTSFQVGDFNMADVAANFQDSFLDSSFVYVLQIISALVTIVLGVSAVFLVIKRKEFDEKMAEQETVLADTAGSGPLQDQWNDIMKHIDSKRNVKGFIRIRQRRTISNFQKRLHFFHGVRYSVFRNIQSGNRHTG